MKHLRGLGKDVLLIAPLLAMSASPFEFCRISGSALFLLGDLINNFMLL